MGRVTVATVRLERQPHHAAVLRLRAAFKAIRLAHQREADQQRSQTQTDQTFLIIQEVSR